MLDLLDYRRRTAEIYQRARLGEGVDAWQTWAADRDQLFETHPQSPIGMPSRSEFRGLSYFAYDPSWRFDAEVRLLTADRVSVAHSGDGHTDFQPFAAVGFELGGSLYELTAYWLSGYGGGVFLPFRDATNSFETYGGGRYLLDTVKGADLGSTLETITLDFNYSYHPSCVYSPRWSCPLAPPANKLELRVEAGERFADPTDGDRRRT